MKEKCKKLSCDGIVKRPNSSVDAHQLPIEREELDQALNLNRYF